jgi:hypothetical protein
MLEDISQQTLHITSAFSLIRVPSFVSVALDNLLSTLQPRLVIIF